MSDIRIKMAKDLRDMSDMVGDLHWMAAKAIEDLTKKECEIAKRDAIIYAERIDADLQRQELDAANGNLAGMRAELSALKAQEPVEYQIRALIRDVTNIPEAGYYMPQSWHDQVIALSLSGKLDAPVSEARAQGVEHVQWLVRYLKAETVSDGWWQDSSEQRAAWCAEANQQQHANGLPATWEIRRLTIAAPVQQVSVPDVSAMARILADRNADACNVNREDNWMIYGQDYIDDVAAMLAAAPAAPAADAGLVEALELAANRLDRLALEQGEFWRGYATAWADEARATANGVKS